MFKTQMVAFVTTILAVAASACSGAVARPVATAAGDLACVGGTVRNSDDAVRYEGCEAVAGDLRITQSDLIDVSAFKQLRSISGNLVIEGNAKLVSLAGLKHVEHARSVVIRSNRVLSAFPTLLPELKHVEESVVLDSNRGLSRGQISAVLERVEVRAAQERRAVIHEAVTANIDGVSGERVN